jgi:hypothetical protein
MIKQSMGEESMNRARMIEWENSKLNRDRRKARY